MSAIAETRFGKLRGAREDDLCVFKGVPFAAPPVGARRWLPPEPPEPWSGVRHALEFGAVAPQNPMQLEVLDAFLIDQPQSEDCLYLNVWTRGLDDARRPVLVWIHGGGFVIGAGSQDIYDGAALARRGDVVVVTANYRLGPLGFLNLKEVTGGRIPATGNEGLLDQVAALEWVRDNIAGFGGDPENVTLFGESAGGMSVAALLGMPRARGLCHRAIPQSGAGSTASTPERAVRVARRLLERVGVRPRDADALRSLSAAQLLGASEGLIALSAEPDPEIGNMPLQPVIDGDVLPRLAIDSVAAGSAAGVPLLVGSTLEEWKLFGPADASILSLDEDGLAARVARRIPAARVKPLVEAYRRARAERGAATPPAELLQAIETDRVFRVPALRLVEAQRAHESRVYSYLFTWTSPALGGMLGACHALELGFLFGTYAMNERMERFAGSGPGAEALAAAIQDSWLAFAASGDPSCDAVGRVPAYGPGLRATLLLGEKSTVEEAPYDAERRAWDGIGNDVVGSL